LLETIRMNSKLDVNFTIVVPTYHEAKNIKPLIKRISHVDFGNRCFEVLLIDDNSQDGTIEIVNSLTSQYPWLRLIVRNQERNLSESVIEGFNNANYPIIITMDADLSHPPEKIPEMLAMLAEPNVDIVIGSRYVKGGSTDKRWPFIRKITSLLAALVTRTLFLTPIKDPLSGFLGIRKKTFTSGDLLKPIGWKIGLEIMIKCRCQHIREIPIHFSRRCHGASKLNFKILFNYLQHIVRLVCYRVFYRP